MPIAGTSATGNRDTSIKLNSRDFWILRQSSDHRTNKGDAQLLEPSRGYRYNVQRAIRRTNFNLGLNQSIRSIGTQLRSGRYLKHNHEVALSRQLRVDFNTVLRGPLQLACLISQMITTGINNWPHIAYQMSIAARL